MSYAIQFDLFEEINDEYIFQKELDLLKKEVTNTRRGLFARHSEMMKLIMKQQEEINILKYMISSKKEIIDFTVHKK